MTEHSAQAGIGVSTVEGHDLRSVLIQQVFEAGGVKAILRPISHLAVLVRAEVFGVEPGVHGQRGSRREGKDHHVVGGPEVTSNGHLASQVA